ncbi:hypothetical protein [Emticicia soli]|uniref:Uncharacterized protein n=1 Tax=Emticicia soli TaxID=2027878 RepID=A0ABW5J3B1_9BACT
MLKRYLYASVAGISIGLVTIYVLPAEFELFLWPVLIVVIGYFAARTADQGLFWLGFRYAIVVGISISFTHLILTNDYFLSHPEEKQHIEDYNRSLAPQLVLLMWAPVYWLILGALSGLLTVLWSKVNKAD